MSKVKVTVKNIKDYMTSKRWDKWYFTFPWLKKPRKLIVVLRGLMKYWRNDPNKKFQFNFDKMREDMILEEAVKAYKERVKQDEKV